MYICYGYPGIIMKIDLNFTLKWAKQTHFYSYWPLVSLDVDMNEQFVITNSVNQTGDTFIIKLSAIDGSYINATK